MPGGGDPPMMSDGPVVGVVGPEADAVAAAVRAAGGVPDAAPATEVDGAAYVVAVGEPALLAVARARPDALVLPVAAGRGVRSVPRAATEAAVERVLAGEYDRERYPLVDVTVTDRTTATALMDVMLVSAEPAQISEYAVSADGERVAQFRSDGVVVATPAGSPGYADAAGGPVLASGADVATVVPVAPFATDADHWVLPFDPLCLFVERDDPAVQLVADDRVVGRVDPTDPVRLSSDGSVDVAVVAASESRFEM